MAANTHFFGSGEPLHIFQDDMFDTSRPMTSHAPMPTSTKSSRAPLGSANANVVFNPPHGSSQFSFSPYKPKSSPRSPLKASNSNKLKTVSMAPPHYQALTTDSPQKKPYLSQFKTGSQKPSMDFNLDFGKENVHPRGHASSSSIDFNIETFYQNPSKKRTLLDAALITESSSPAKRHKTLEDSLPSPNSFPPIIDDGSKPNHSYATLIAMAILRSPNRRLTLSQIYKWIHTTYSFYGPVDSGWQNSIRHNLSLNKAFVKTERPKDDPGKGNYWTIEPGTEMQFLKEKPTRKSAPTAENLPVMSTRLEPSGPTSAPMQEPTLPPPAPINYGSLPQLPTSQATVSMPAEPSSDATIPVSDNAPAEEAGDLMGRNEFVFDASLYSPVQVAIDSSPPVPRKRQPSHSATPPSVNRHIGSSAARPTRRKAAPPVADSGYISSLESSVMRSTQRNPKVNLLTSEADRPRIRRGRAEAEIIRLRGSSPFSPTKNRSHSGFNAVSSSPLRQAYDNVLLNPGTPDVLLMKPPPPPPTSASPNTSLRLHRNKVSKMLRTPIRNMPEHVEEHNWSPAFHLMDSDFVYDKGLLPLGFDVFEDLSGMAENELMSAVEMGSPVRRTGPRPQLTRTASTPALGERANYSSRKPTAVADLLRAPGQNVMPAVDTPSKVFEGLSSPSKMIAPSPGISPSKGSRLLEVPGGGDWESLVFDPNEFTTSGNVDSAAVEEDGLDMLQGFQKIGSVPMSNPKGRAPLGRSYSTRF